MINLFVFKVKGYQNTYIAAQNIYDALAMFIERYPNAKVLHDNIEWLPNFII